MKRRVISLTGIFLVSALFAMAFLFTAKSKAQQYANPLPPKDYKGVIKLDVRDSKADWAPYIRKKAPEGSPNILFLRSSLSCILFADV